MLDPYGIVGCLPGAHVRVEARLPRLHPRQAGVPGVSALRATGDSADRAVLNPKGIFVGVGAPPDVPLSRLLAGLIGALVQSVFVSQKLAVFVARVNEQDLTTLGDLMATGKLTPVIDRRYRLSEARDAFRYMEEGHARGKVVITPED